MGIRIDGNNDLIKAVDDTLTIEGISVNTSGMVTATGGIKVGTAATIHSTGQFNIGVAHTLFANGNATHSGIVTAASFVGSGANLTGITQTTINNNADDRVITGSGSANTLNGESNFTFDGVNINQSMSSDNRGLKQVASGNHYIINTLNANRSSANDLIAMIESRWNSTHVADISFHAGEDTSNKDDGYISFRTSASAGGISERLRITSVGISTFTETGTGNGMGGVVASTASAGGNAGFQWATNSKGRYQVTTIGSEGSESLRVYDIQNGAERLRVDGSGRVLIGTTTEGESTADDLTIATSGSTGITLRSGTSSEGNIFFSDGTSGTAEYRGTIQYDHNNDRLVIFTAGTERMRIDSLGQVEITSDNNGQLIHKFYNKADEGNATHTVEHHFNFNRTSGAMNLSGARIVAGKEREWIGAASNQDGFLAFYTCLNESPGEKMRIGSNNIFLHSTNSSGSDGRIYTNNAGANHATLEINQNSGSGTEMMAFRNGGTQIGSITQSSSNTSYNTGSDYRLKENDVAISDGITRLKQLRPIRFNWKTDPSTTQDGFFAHEVQTIVPESVRGNKDEVFDTDGVGTQVKGGIKIQQLDHSKLVPLLTAALKEAITEIETLKTKVAALEGG